MAAPKKKPAPKAKGFIGMYKGPKPRAYSSLSKADKAKEDAQNERDMKKGSGPGRKPTPMPKKKP